MKIYLERLFNDTKESFYEYVENCLKKNQKKFIVTVNPETIMLCKKDNEIKNILLDDDNILIPDGIGIVKGMKKLNIPVKERITGIDLAIKLLEIANDNKYKLALLGAKKEVNDKLVKVIKEKYPNICLVKYEDGYIKNKDNFFEDLVKLKPDICLVALGIPEQEKIIYRHLQKFKKGIFVGVGGSFDVISGRKKRAPKLFIKTNTEWLYRIVREPSRLKRFWNNNIKFLKELKK